MPGESPGGAGLSEVINTLKELVSPEMIRALSPTEGFECTAHTFQAIETEGRWKDASLYVDRGLWPPVSGEQSPGKLVKREATILSIQIGALSTGTIAAIVNAVLGDLVPQTTLATLALPVSQSLPPAIAKAFPALDSAIRALSRPSTVEIAATWWADGLEIWAGQAAAKHVTGFNSLFGSQARVDLDGVSFGNYFPLPYLLSFTGYVNPVGPTFEEIRGAVRLDADGRATGMFFERSNRDKATSEDDIPYGGQRSGYQLRY